MVRSADQAWDGGSLMLERYVGPITEDDQFDLASEYDQEFLRASTIRGEVFARVKVFSDGLLKALKNAEEHNSQMPPHLVKQVRSLSDELNGAIRELVTTGQLNTQEAFELSLACRAYISHIIMKDHLHRILVVADAPELRESTFMARLLLVRHCTS